jgi:cellulose synthase/poly-beta-1,6-N-acetylglucosamine synthase-like glycosyltransferase
MNFKGSFFICQHGVEKSITFDHGLEGSITEDSYFVIKASNQGYSFGWIDGEMYEQSPFTFMDFLRQRKRWHQDAYYIAFSKNLKRDLSGTAYMLLFFLSFFTVMGTASIFLSLFSQYHFTQLTFV